jgi:hypothetical protein
MEKIRFTGQGTALSPVFPRYLTLLFWGIAYVMDPPSIARNVGGMLETAGTALMAVSVT